jgi:hypothetical protein
VVTQWTLSTPIRSLDAEFVAVRQLWLPYGNRTIYRAQAVFLMIFEVPA